MAPSDTPIRLGGSELSAQRHVCAFFHSADEEDRVLMPFIAEGFARGERAFHIVDPELRADHVGRLRSAGVDVATAEQSGQLGCATGPTRICATVISIKTGCWR